MSDFGMVDRTELKSSNFSLVLGGPLYQILSRTHLSDDALRHVRSRILLFAIVCWLPLLVLSALDGHLRDDGVAVPFFKDIEVYSRFLLALPLLIVAELVVHVRMRYLIQQFQERGLVPEGVQERFGQAIGAALRLRNSVAAELALVAIVYGLGIAILWRHFMSLEASTWYAVPTPDGPRLSLAGYWYGYVSLPIFQFLLCRWYFRLFVWTRFLWHISRLELSLMPMHPDGAGGLGFLGTTVYAFTPLLVGHGVLLSGFIGNRIFHVGERLVDFKFEVAVLVGFLLCALLGPLLMFAPQLAAARRQALREYGALAGRYVREFDGKWLRRGAPVGEALVGSADIQSLADLNNSFEVVRKMKLVPFGKDALLQLGAATLAPLVPLLLTIMPLEDLVKTLFGILF
jgi:hypothetical protein